MKVVWTNFANSNPQAIHDYIALTSVDYARTMIERLTSQSRQIEPFPLAGRVVPEFQVGQLREVFERPYRIIYRIRPDRVDIITVVHMSRQLKPDVESEPAEV